MGVDDQTQLTERGKRAVDRRAVDAWSGSFSAGNDLVGSEVLFRAVKNFDDRLGAPGSPAHADPGAHPTPPGHGATPTYSPAYSPAS